MSPRIPHCKVTSLSLRSKATKLNHHPPQKKHPNAKTSQDPAPPKKQLVGASRGGDASITVRGDVWGRLGAACAGCVCVPQGPWVGIGLVVRLCQGNTICFNTQRAWEWGRARNWAPKGWFIQELCAEAIRANRPQCLGAGIVRPQAQQLHGTSHPHPPPGSLLGFRCCSHQVCLSWSRIRARDGLRAPGLAAWRMLQCQQLGSFKRETLEASERPPPDISSEPYY